MGSLARVVFWPLRRFFDPRFEGLGKHLDDLRAEALQLNHEAVVARGDIAATVRRIEELLKADTTASNETATVFGRSLADLLEYVEEVRGGIRALQGHQVHAVEGSYAFRALGSVPKGASVLAIGAQEAGFADALAALGYRVEAVEAPSAIAPGASEAPFDAVVLLSISTLRPEIVHQLAAVLTAGGLLVVSTRQVDGLDRVLSDWTVEDIAHAVRVDGAWRIAADAGSGVERLSLITARKAG